MRLHQLASLLWNLWQGDRRDRHTGLVRALPDHFFQRRPVDPARHFQGYVNTSLTIVMMICVVVILSNAIWKWTRVLSGRQAIAEAAS